MTIGGIVPFSSYDGCSDENFAHCSGVLEVGESVAASLRRRCLREPVSKVPFPWELWFGRSFPSRHRLLESTFLARCRVPIVPSLFVCGIVLDQLPRFAAASISDSKIIVRHAFLENNISLKETPHQPKTKGNCLALVGH